jgi:ParB-like chromosome segregation protein Spo0J
MQEIQLLTVPEGTVVEVPIAQLSDHPTNATIYEDTPAEELSEMMLSIQDFGIREPIQILNTGRILSGHRRTKAARLLGHSTVPCLVRHDIRTEQQADIILLLHNAFQREKTNTERMREIAAYAELISGLRALDDSSSGKKITELRMRRAEACRDLDPQLAEQLRDEVKQFQNGSAFQAMEIAARKYKVRGKTLRLSRVIIQHIDRLRKEGFAKEAEELVALHNKNIAAAKKLVDTKYSAPKKKMRARKIEDTCTLMTETLKNGMRNVLPLLKPQGQSLVQDAMQIMDRLKYHVREETEEEKQMTRQGVEYTPAGLGF